MLLPEGFGRYVIISILSFHTFLMSFPELFNRISVRAHLLIHVVIQDVYVGVSFAVGLVQFLALVSAGREQSSVLGEVFGGESVKALLGIWFVAFSVKAKDRGNVRTTRRLLITYLQQWNFYIHDRVVTKREYREKRAKFLE